MLAANHQTENGDANEEARERTEGAERVCNPTGKTKLSTNQPHHSSQGLKNQPMISHRKTHCPRYICSRGQHCLASMGGEAFGPAKDPFPRVGECQCAEVGEGSWKREHLHGGNGKWRENVIGKRRITSEM